MEGTKDGADGGVLRWRSRMTCMNALNSRTAGRAGTNSQNRHPERSRKILLSEVNAINTSQVRNGVISMTGLGVHRRTAQTSTSKTPRRPALNHKQL
ncbi:MAG: hypothetical protein ACI9LY_002829 [Arenicella sp.]|jgi:hypothetical protein